MSGAKLWVLFPPRAGENLDGAPVTRKLVKGTHHIAKGCDDEPINYFAEILPHVKRECRALGVPVFEFVQLTGETLFVPPGWWHAVLNLEDSVAVTQVRVGSWARRISAAPAAAVCCRCCCKCCCC